MCPAMQDQSTPYHTYILVSWLRGRPKIYCAYVSHVAQVSDTVQVTRQVSLLELRNCVRTRQEISKHFSIAYNMLYWTMCIFAV